MRYKIAIINGSLGGENGNTGGVLNHLASHLVSWADLVPLHLNDAVDPSSWAEQIREADGFIFATGTYWDSWGSPLQKFLEEMTGYEGSSYWLGKPAVALVTMHSVGGKGVLSRLQGVLSTLGLLLPPMGGMVYSLANQLALQTPDDPCQNDLWGLNDLPVLAHNLRQCFAIPKMSWQTWTVDSRNPRRRWLSEPV